MRLPVPTIKAIFRTHEQALRALSALRSVFADNDLLMSTYPIDRSTDDDEAPVDPSASSAFIGGAPVSTLPAAGYNLVGNSATVDVRLGDLPFLLEAVAESEHDPRQTDARRGGARFAVTVRCISPQETESAQAILKRHGGERLRVSE